MRIMETVLPYKTWDQCGCDGPKAVDGADPLWNGDVSWDDRMSVYVPPSNVLSEEGRALLASKYFLQIRTIASNYFSGEFAYVQEFEAADDGIVEQPRIISGCSDRRAICRWRLFRS